MQYQLVKETVERLSERGWAAYEVAQADGYPIFRLSSGGAGKGRSGDANCDAGNGAKAALEGAPALLIAAGIHGEEPGAVVGLCRWLLEHSEQWRGALRLIVFPCINPWGFERGIRFASDGKDINRQFDAPEHPGAVAFCEYLEGCGERFPLFMDLHEDCDFEAMYLYEMMDAPLRRPGVATLGRRILDRAGERVALYTGAVEHLEARDGLISSGDFDRQRAKEFRGAPIALYAFAHFVPHVVTVETPGLLELDVRAGLHMKALDEACRFLLEPGRTRA